MNTTTITLKFGKEKIKAFTNKGVDVRVFDKTKNEFTKSGVKFGNKYIPTLFINEKDKYGTKIFEGDFIKFQCSPKVSMTGEPQDKFALIYWDNDIKGYNPFIFHFGNFTSGIIMSTVEVVGNIFEHPELYDELRKHHG